MKPLLLLAALAAVSGCTSFAPRTPADAGALQGSFVAFSFHASYTQLTEHYAVTARHAAFLVNGPVLRSERYDLAFFRHDGTPPPWADAVPGEPVTLHGNPLSALDYALELSVGVPLLWPDRETQASQVEGVLPCAAPGVEPFTAVFVRGPVRGGYSGGPVVNAAGAVVAVVDFVVETSSPHEYHYGPGDGIAVPSATVRAEFHRLAPQEVASR